MTKAQAGFLVLLLAALAALAAWAEEQRTLPAQTSLRFVTASGVPPLKVELALSEADRLQGLMERQALDENTGMLFVYPQPQPVSAAFWMYRTRIPLDLAYLDRRGTILAIYTMPPCASKEPLRCASYHSPVPYLFALEVNGGYFLKHGITVGDRAEFALPPH